MERTTTVQLTVKTKEELEKLKMSQRDTFNDIIESLIEDSLEISKQTRDEIEQAIDEIKRGEFLSHKEVKKSLGL